MTATVRRLLRTEALRLGILSGAMALWFLLILGVVRGATGDIVTKTDMMGSSLMKGFGIGSLVGPDALLAQMAGVSFNHPLVLAIVGGITVALGVRACQGELLRGTLDVTLAGPVRRSGYLLGYVLVMLLGTALLLLVAWGSMIGFERALDVPGTLDAGRTAWTCLNAFAVFSTFGGIALFVSVLCGPRGSAMFITIGILVAMFALTFAERIWDNGIVQALGPVSVFHWFDAGAILTGRDVRAVDLLVPLAETAALVGASLWRFERRDL